MERYHDHDPNHRTCEENKSTTTSTPLTEPHLTYAEEDLRFVCRPDQVRPSTVLIQQMPFAARAVSRNRCQQLSRGLSKKRYWTP